MRPIKIWSATHQPELQLDVIVPYFCFYGYIPELYNAGAPEMHLLEPMNITTRG